MKRTIQNQIIIDDDSQQQEKELRQLPSKKVKRETNEQFGLIKFSQGKVDADQNIREQQVAPWMTKHTKEIKDSLLRFHNEIIDFYEYVGPTKNDHQQRKKVIQQIDKSIKKVLPQAQLRVFGSFSTKLYLPDSDIDLVIVLDDQQQHQIRRAYNKVYQYFQKEPQYYTDLKYISKAKVPLIKAKSVEFDIPFDISINKLDGLEQIKHVQRALKLYPQLKYIMFVFKCMLRIRNMHQTYEGGIGGFLSFLMVFIYLRDVHQKKKYYLLSEHILRFLEFFTQPLMERKTIHTDTGFMSDRTRRPNSLSILSPQEKQFDIAEKSFMMSTILKMFKNRFRYMTNYNFKSGQSLLKQLVNPSNIVFKYYKGSEHLEKNQIEAQVSK